MPKYSAGGYENLSATDLLDKLQARGERIKTAGKVLRYLRKEAGLTQREVADKLKIVQQTYAGYENGHHEPNLDLLIQLANHYGVTLDFISGRVFDDWIIQPFSFISEGKDSLVDLLEHAQRQYTDMGKFSYMVMDNRIHGEYEKR